MKRCFWALDELGEAVSALVTKAGLVVPNANISSRRSPADGLNPGPFIEWQAQMLGCEAQRLDATSRNFEGELATAAPAIVRVGDDEFVAIHRVKRGSAYVVTPARHVVKLPLSRLCAELRSPAEDKIRDEYRDLLQRAEIPERKRARVIRQLLDEQTGQKPFGDAWILRSPLNTGLCRFLVETGVRRKGSSLVAAHLLQYLFWLASWAILGKLSIEGRMDKGWLLAWALLLLGIVPLRTLTTWLQGSLATEVGMGLKRRLLHGALKSEPNEVRKQGVGSLLGQAFEAEAVESLALSGGITGVLALVEILVSSFVLGKISIFLVVWCAVTAVVVWRFLLRYQAWTRARMEMTGQLVEVMVGNRTRLAQQARSEWHRKEDEALAEYVKESSQVDRVSTWLVTALPRGWLIVGLSCLAFDAVRGPAPTGTVALQLGGILLAFNAFRKLAASSSEIAAAVVAGSRIAPLFQSAAKPESLGRTPPGHPGERSGRVVAELEKATFRYREGGIPTLHSVSLAIKQGERVLLEGPSGSGKSTFASLVSGMRKPDSGLVLINGLDGYTLGSQGWRRRVASSPQFHDNHILTETLAFNLFMGRSWPPTRSDVAEAREICSELGLNSLLDRMPGGLMQMVGEGGWQLSHGERSRIYIARSLLQDSEFVILDESFGALDPETVTAALRCTVKRARTLLVIAHP
ncbi:MAG: ATP-binding cassette domain-containing protein [Bryobacteraceae bacterium]